MRPIFDWIIVTRSIVIGMSRLALGWILTEADNHWLRLLRIGMKLRKVGLRPPSKANGALPHTPVVAMMNQGRQQDCIHA